MRWRFPLGPFQKYQGNPVLSLQGTGWEAKDVFNPTAIVKDDTVYLLYRAEDTTGAGLWNGTSRIGLALSHDGVHFIRNPEPVLAPTEPYEWPGGCEDPRVVEIQGLYFLTYTAFDGKVARLCLATSTDLFHWTKHGPMLPDFRLPDGTPWTKSGAILPQPVGGRYWMYFGDTAIWLAWSSDLFHWTFEPEPVLTPSPDPTRFDSELVEPGPAPWMTGEGVVLLYNGARQMPTPPDMLPARHYGVGQALFAADNPGALIARTAEPFLSPTEAGAQRGQVNHVVFAEGLVEFHGDLLLYYGMADSHIGVARADARAEAQAEQVV